jgi:hypothetical protein
VKSMTKQSSKDDAEQQDEHDGQIIYCAKSNFFLEHQIKLAYIAENESSKY